MARFKPSIPFSVAMKLWIPTETKVNGVPKKVFAAPKNDPIFNGTFRTFGGTERSENNLYIVEDTAEVQTWFRPDVTSGCRVEVLATGGIYDVIGEPENIELRNQYMQFKVRRTKGGA